MRIVYQFIGNLNVFDVTPSFQEFSDLRLSGVMGETFKIDEAVFIESINFFLFFFVSFYYGFGSGLLGLKRTLHHFNVLFFCWVDLDSKQIFIFRQLFLYLGDVQKMGWFTFGIFEWLHPEEAFSTGSNMVVRT